MLEHLEDFFSSSSLDGFQTEFFPRIFMVILEFGFNFPIPPPPQTNEWFCPNGGQFNSFSANLMLCWLGTEKQTFIALIFLRYFIEAHVNKQLESIDQVEELWSQLILPYKVNIKLLKRFETFLTALSETTRSYIESTFWVQLLHTFALCYCFVICCFALASDVIVCFDFDRDVIIRLDLLRLKTRGHRLKAFSVWLKQS